MTDEELMALMDRAVAEDNKEKATKRRKEAVENDLKSKALRDTRKKM